MDASWMSAVVFPLPDAESGSLLVAEANTTPADGSQTSVTCQAVCTGTSWWFGGQSVVGLTARASDGGVVSRTKTEEAHVTLFPEASVAVKVTPVVPSG